MLSCLTRSCQPECRRALPVASSAPTHSQSAAMQSQQALEGPISVHVAGLAPNIVQGAQKLSPLDHTAILTCVNPKALWYRKALDPFVLRASLSVVLRQYPCFAGRLAPHASGRLQAWVPPPRRTTPRGVTPLAVAKHIKEQAYYLVLCNAGVPVRVAHASQWSLEDFPQAAMGRKGFGAGPSLAKPLLPPWYEPVDIVDLLAGQAPVLSVRLTRLGCGGCILALTISHAVVDGRSVCGFLGNWAAVYREMSAVGPLPPVTPPLPAASGNTNSSNPNGKAVPSEPRPGSGATSMPPSTTPSKPPAPAVPPSHDRDLLLAPHDHPLTTAAAGTPAPRVIHVTARSGHNGAAPPQASTRRPAATSAPYRYALVLGEVVSGATDTRPEAGADGRRVQSSSPLADGATDTTAPAGDHITARKDTSASSSSSSSSSLAGTATAPQKLSVKNGSAMVGAGASPLRCLELQMVSGPVSWRGAVKQSVRALKGLREEEARWPQLFTHLTTSFIHLPPDTVAHVKALAASDAAVVPISTNDALTALAWVLVCHLRGRPLPGYARPGQPQALGMAVDLRQNGLLGHLPLSLCANATWCIHVPSPTAGHYTAALPARAPSTTPHPATATLPQQGEAAPTGVPVPAHADIGSGPGRLAGPATVAAEPEPAPATLPLIPAIASKEAPEVPATSSPPAAGAVSPVPPDPSDNPQTLRTAAVPSGVAAATTLPRAEGTRGTCAAWTEPAPPAPNVPELTAESVASKATATSLVSLQQAWAAAQASKVAKPLDTGHPLAHHHSLASLLSLRYAAATPTPLTRARSMGPVLSRRPMRTCSAAAAAAALMRQGSGMGGRAGQWMMDSRVWPASALGEGVLSGSSRSHTVSTRSTGASASSSLIGTQPLPDDCTTADTRHTHLTAGVSSGGQLEHRQWATALRLGAAAIRAAVLEVRAHDPLAAGSSGTPPAAAAAMRGGGEIEPADSEGEAAATGRQRGWDILEHAYQLTQIPMSAQLTMAANVFCGQDVMCTTWSFPYYQVDFGQGGPVRHQGIVHPSPPWAAAIQPAPPDLDGMLIQINTPTSALAALRTSTVLTALAPGAFVL